MQKWCQPFDMEGERWLIWDIYFGDITITRCVVWIKSMLLRLKYSIDLPKLFLSGTPLSFPALLPLNDFTADAANTFRDINTYNYICLKK